MRATLLGKVWGNVRRIGLIVGTALFALLLTMGPAAAASTVLFDQGHGQHFLVEGDRPLDLSGLAGVFTQQGAAVATSRTLFTPSQLAGVDVLVISGPFIPISEQEGDALLHFVEKGGKLALMVHISQPFLSLFPQLGVVVSSLAVYEKNNIISGNPRDFMVNALQPHPLTKNLDAFAVYGAWALRALRPDVKEIAHTSAEAWVDLNQNGELNERDAKQAFAMIVTGTIGKGSFVVFGDDAIFQNRFLQGGNRRLAENLAQWFCPPQNAI